MFSIFSFSPFCFSSSLFCVVISSTGGDMFCLYYNKAENKVYGLNGSGRSPSALTLESLPAELREDITASIPLTSPFAVTVPGTVAGHSFISYRT